MSVGPTRREILQSMTGLGIAAAAPRALAAHHDAAFTVLATGLQAPEGPKALQDGSVLVCEMARGTLSRVHPDGAIGVVAELGGSPNGVAISTEGAAYVVNNGGMKFSRRGELLIPDPPALHRSGGSVQRVDLKSGEVTVLYSGQSSPIRAPNDIAIDRWGDLWFTDPGVEATDGRPAGALFWARPDGGELRQVSRLAGPNGIAFAPDHRTLYVAQTAQQTVVAYEVTGPGAVARNADGAARTRVVAQLSTPKSYFDSMAVEADGTLIVGTLFQGCLSLFRPDGQLRDQLYFPEQFVTNLAFGGVNFRTAYVTLTTSGRLVQVHWPRPGLRLVNQ